MSRSQGRIWKRNGDLQAMEISPRATSEQFELFVAYQESRHSGGDMSKMDYRDYQSLVEDTPVETKLVEFRLPDQSLAAACLMDRVDTGLSAVYSFFQPSLIQRSLGTYMILWLIEQARALELEHVYLGFWIDGCAKMSYKAKFQPLEIWTVDEWRLFSSFELVLPSTPHPWVSRGSIFGDFV